MSLDQLEPLMMYMAVQKTHNEALWGALVRDLDSHIELGSVSNVQIFSVMRSLHAMDLLNEDITESMIQYLVRRGYDSDDLMSMSSRKGGYRKAVHLITLVA